MVMVVGLSINDLTKEDLEELYINKKLSAQKIGKLYGVSRPTIINRVIKFGIPIRKFKLNLEGQKFGHLTVIERVNSNDVHNQVVWLCECDCQNKTRVTRVSNSLYRNSHISCGCEDRHYKPTNETIKRLSGKYLVYGHWTIIQKAAKVRNLEFNITLNYVENLLEKQNFCCALSKIPFIFSQRSGSVTSGIKNISLDRINSSKGYIEDNVRWIHKYINTMKNDYSDTEFLYICKKISEHNNINLTETEIRLIEHSFDINKLPINTKLLDFSKYDTNSFHYEI